MLPEHKLVGCTVEVAVEGKKHQFGEVFSDLGSATALRLTEIVTAAVGDRASIDIWHESGLVSLSGVILYVHGHFLMVGFQLAPPAESEPPLSATRAVARPVIRPVARPERRIGRQRLGSSLSLGEYWVGRRVASHF